MGSKYLLDTSIIIDFLRQKDKANTHLYKLSLEDVSLYISIITHTELYAGKRVWESKVAETALNDLFDGLIIVPINTNISKNAGKIRSVYGIDLIDAIIAATAIQEKLPMLTLNTRHFNKITGLKLGLIP